MLLVGNFLSRHSGIRGVCEDLAGRLRAAGWPIVTTSSSRTSVGRGLDMVSTAIRRSSDFDVAQIDLFSGRAFLWAEIVTAILRARRIPYILTAHGGGLPAFARRRSARVVRVLNGAAAVTAPSKFLARELEALRNDILVIRNGLDLSAYSFRERSSIAPRLIWLRAMHEVYDPALAVRVVPRLVDDYPTVTLSMIGPDKGGKALDEVKSTIDELGLHDRVTLIKPIAKHEVSSYLESADIFLNTSRVDNAPVTLIEAMACGLCVVTTDAGGIPDLVQADLDVLMAPVGDADAMARAIMRILEDGGLAGRLSRNGRVVAERHDWRNIFPVWESLLNEVATRA